MSDDINSKAGKAGLWYTIANLLLKGCVFLSLPIFTRILSTSDFGIYNTYIAYEGLIQAFLGLGLYGTVKNAKLDFGKKYEEYISSVFSLSLVLFVLVIIVANIIYPVYGDLIGFTRVIVNCLLVQSFGAYFIHFYGVYLNAEFRYKGFVAVSIFNTIGSIVLSIVLIIFVFPNERYMGRIFGSAFIPAIITILIGTFLLVKNKVLFHKKYWKFALTIGLPLIPHVVSQSLLSQFDRIMINNMVGSSESGIYSYMYTICTVTYIIALSMDNAWTPWLFHKINAGNQEEIYRASKKYIYGFAIISIGFMCLIPEVSKIIAATDYWGGIDLAIPLSIANYCIFLYLMPVSIEYYHKKTLFISLGTMLAAGINLVLNYLFIGRFGYKAAAYTTLISYFLLFFFHSWIAKKYEYLKVIEMKSVIIATAFVFIIGFTFQLTYSYYILNLIIRLIVLVVLLIAIYSQRGLLKNLRRVK